MLYIKYNKKNSYSLAALAAVVPQAALVREPHDGIMLYSLSTKQADAVFEEVGNATTSSIFIAGGPHPSGAPEETLRYFDYVVIGEGEETLPHLLKTIESRGDVSQVKGIAYVDRQSGKVVRTEPRDHVDLNKYPCFDPRKLLAPIEISRGCPWRCKYCQTPRIFGSSVRHRDIDSIVTCAKYQRDLRFTSSNAFAYGGDGIHSRLDKVERLLSTLHRMEKPIYFGTFPSEVRPEFVTDDALELVVRYCTNQTISIGAQSASDRILKEIWRGHTVDDVITAVERCSCHGISPVVDFIFGYPTETEEDQQDSLNLIKWICRKGGSVRAHYLTPLPDTPYADVEPSKVSSEVNRVLGRLALEGKVTGSWE